MGVGVVLEVLGGNKTSVVYFEERVNGHSYEFKAYRTEFSGLISLILAA